MQLNLDRQTAGGCARHLLAAFNSGSEEQIGWAFDTIGGMPLPATMDSSTDCRPISHPLFNQSEYPRF